MYRTNPSNTKNRILLLTLLGRKYNNNYGAVLQGLALQKFLEDKGYRVKILDYNPSYMRNWSSLPRKIISYIKKGKFKQLLEKLVTLISNKVTGRFSREVNRPDQKRMAKFDVFKASHVNFSDKAYSSGYELENDAERLRKGFDIFLVGSDQVWNPKFHSREQLGTNLLSFISDVPKISYASSISSSVPDELSEFYKNYLSQFSKISVREKESAKEVQRILGYEPKICVDPTLLLTSHDWERFAKKPSDFEIDGFLFVYDLYRSEDILPIVEKLSTEKGLKYVNFNPHGLLYRKKYKNLSYNFYKEGPSEFLWLLKESNFVITSSFHGVVYSIIFKKPFYAILWHKKEMEKQNGRILDILTRLGLENRALIDPNEILQRGLDENINWHEIEKRLDNLRSDSTFWLLEALKDSVPSESYELRKSDINDVSSVEECAGCFACYNICPTNAIEMVPSEEGFYIPKIRQDVCIHCGKCYEACPVVNYPFMGDRFKQPKTYVSWSLDENTRLNSSSGGIYPELARYILKNSGAVFAVGWNDKWLPQHVLVENFDDIKKTVGSKYVQSYVGKVYDKVANFVRNGKEVLFVGTPCQVGGLRNFLRLSNLNDEKVTTVDLICYGVPSPKVFAKYLKENFKDEDIINYSFRSKIRGWSRSTIEVEAKKEVYVKPFGRDSFGHGFLANIYLNMHCYNCIFSHLPRQGDITVGDFWGVPEQFKDEKGVSVVLVNSRRGEELFNALANEEKTVFASEVSLECAIAQNPRIIIGKYSIPAIREKFFADLDVKDWNYLSKRYIKSPVGIRGIIRSAGSKAFRLVKKVLKKL